MGGDAPCIFDTRPGEKERRTVSVVESSEAAHIIPEFQGRMELENPGKHEIIRLNQTAITKTVQKWVHCPLE
jgi:hypothetical protein